MENLNIIFIGHVDSGKSTLCGHLMVKHQKLDAHELSTLKKFSEVFDIDPQERLKSKTSETAMLTFVTDKRNFTILDAPGHRAYVPSMIECVTQADVAILVISARASEFEDGFDKDGQTREHAILARTAGVSSLVVAINKLDDPTVDWDESRYQYIQKRIIPFLKEIGWRSQMITFFPVSGLSGDGIVDNVPSGVSEWANKHPTLQHILDNTQTPIRKVDDVLRFPIVGCHKDTGVITVSGKVLSGSISPGQQVVISPINETAVISGDQTYIAGDNVCLSLRSINIDLIRSGYVLTNTNKAVSVFHAKLIALDLSTIISEGFTAMFHIHTAVEQVSVDKLLAIVDNKQKIKEKYPRFLKSNEQAMVRFRTTLPVCIETHKDFDKMGRFMLRSDGITIGIGVVTKIL
jgi:peptide chain release factor subunit 3